jgi:hypothetical protein
MFNFSLLVIIYNSLYKTRLSLCCKISRQSSLSQTTHTTSEAGAHNAKIIVKVTTNVTVVREGI